jgi:hypothetical protein
LKETGFKIKREVIKLLYRQEECLIINHTKQQENNNNKEEKFKRWFRQDTNQKDYKMECLVIRRQQKKLELALAHIHSPQLTKEAPKDNH